VFAAMRDKRMREMLDVLLPETSRLVVTAASTPRSAEPAAIAAIARELSPALAIDIEPRPAAALDRAWRSSPDIVVAGSIFLLGDVLKLINGS
jgi:dihydrofolate synthase / folylpolyglutamate synthase